jgi:hypothetical protein
MRFALGESLSAILDLPSANRPKAYLLCTGPKVFDLSISVPKGHSSVAQDKVHVLG